MESYINSPFFQDANPSFPVVDTDPCDDLVRRNIVDKATRASSTSDPISKLTGGKKFTASQLEDACGDEADECAFTKIMAEYGVVLRLHTGYLVGIAALNDPRYNIMWCLNTNCYDIIERLIRLRDPDNSEIECTRRNLRSSIAGLYAKHGKGFGTSGGHGTIVSFHKVTHCESETAPYAGARANCFGRVGPLMEFDPLLPLYRVMMCTICFQCFGLGAQIYGHIHNHRQFLAATGRPDATSDDIFELGLAHMMGGTYIAVRLSQTIRMELCTNNDRDIIQIPLPTVQDKMLDMNAPSSFLNTVSGADSRYYLLSGFHDSQLCSKMLETYKTLLFNRYVSECQDYVRICRLYGMKIAWIANLCFYGTLCPAERHSDPKSGISARNPWFRPLSKSESYRQYSHEAARFCFILLLGINASLNDPVLDLPGLQDDDLHKFLFTQDELDLGAKILKALKAAANEFIHTNSKLEAISADVANARVCSRRAIVATQAEFRQFFDSYEAVHANIDAVYDMTLRLLYLCASNSHGSIVATAMDTSRTSAQSWLQPLVATFLLAVADDNPDHLNEAGLKFIPFAKRSRVLAYYIYAIRIAILHRACLKCTVSGQYDDWLLRNDSQSEQGRWKSRADIKRLDSVLLTDLDDVNSGSMGIVAKEIYYPTVRSKRLRDHSAQTRRGVYFPDKGYLVYLVGKQHAMLRGSVYRTFGPRDVHTYIEKSVSVMKNCVNRFCSHVNYSRIKGLKLNFANHTGDFRIVPGYGGGGSFVDQMSSHWYGAIADWMKQNGHAAWDDVLDKLFDRMNYAIMAYIALTGFPMRATEFRDLIMDVPRNSRFQRGVFCYKVGPKDKRTSILLFFSTRHKSTRASHEKVSHWVMSDSVSTIMAIILGPIRYCKIASMEANNHRRVFLNIRPNDAVAPGIVKSIGIPMGYRQLRDALCQMWNHFTKKTEREASDSGSTAMEACRHFLAGHTMNTYNTAYDVSLTNISLGVAESVLSMTKMFALSWLTYTARADPSPHEGVDFHLSASEASMIAQANPDDPYSEVCTISVSSTANDSDDATSPGGPVDGDAEVDADDEVPGVSELVDETSFSKEGRVPLFNPDDDSASVEELENYCQREEGTNEIRRTHHVSTARAECYERLEELHKDLFSNVRETSTGFNDDPLAQSTPAPVEHPYVPTQKDPTQRPEVQVPASASVTAHKVVPDTVLQPTSSPISSKKAKSPELTATADTTVSSSQEPQAIFKEQERKEDRQERDIEEDMDKEEWDAMCSIMHDAENDDEVDHQADRLKRVSLNDDTGKQCKRPPPLSSQSSTLSESSTDSITFLEVKEARVFSRHLFAEHEAEMAMGIKHRKKRRRKTPKNSSAETTMDSSNDTIEANSSGLRKKKD